VDAPTFLPPHDTLEDELPTGYRESRASIAPTHKRPAHKPASQKPQAQIVEPAPAPRVKSSSSPSIVTSAPRPLPATRGAATPQPSRSAAAPASVQKEPVAPAQAPAPEPRSRPSSPSQASQASAQSRPSAPSQPSIPAEQLPPFVQLPNGGASFDPNLLPLPPELAPTIYQWLRRFALQAELANADKLLRDAFVELTSALSVVIYYPGADGLIALGTDDEQPKDPQPIIAVAAQRRAIATTHTALVPISTSTECVGVVQLTRNPRQPAFGLVELVAMAALAREAAGVIHHLVVQHLTHAQELASDKQGLYRPRRSSNTARRARKARSPSCRRAGSAPRIR